MTKEVSQSRRLQSISSKSNLCSRTIDDHPPGINAASAGRSFTFDGAPRSCRPWLRGVGRGHNQWRRATPPEPIYKRWFREFYAIDPTVRISYQGIGSGAGIKQFTAGLVHFGASDSAMSPKEIQEVPRWGVQLLPMTGGRGGPLV